MRWSIVRRSIVIGVVLALMRSNMEAGLIKDSWRNYGFCSSTTVWDANALAGSNAQWASVKAKFTTISDPNNSVLLIPVPEWADTVYLRFRASDVNTAGTIELLGLVGTNDASYICYLTLTADASAMPATAIVDGNDTSMTIKHSGYYFGNIADSNGSDFASLLSLQNCNTSHRMGMVIWYVENTTSVIVHPTSVANGTIYWDACFSGEK